MTADSCSAKLDSLLRYQSYQMYFSMHRAHRIALNFKVLDFFLQTPFSQKGLRDRIN